jgi:hypothetical protein
MTKNIESADRAPILMRGVVASLVASVAFAAAFAADACTPLPNTLANGNTADATQVMGNFNGILACPLFVTGNVGIGTATPTYTLDVVGDMRVTGTVAHTDGVMVSGATFPAFGIYNTGQSTDQHWAELGDLNGVFVGRFVNDAYSASNYWLKVTRNASTYTTQYVIFPSGNIGISNSAPDAMLSLDNSLSTIKAAIYDSGPSALYGIGVNSGQLTFGAGIAATGTAQMVLTNGGKVGISTITPNAQLSLGSAIQTIKVAVYDGGSTNLFGMGVNSSELTCAAGVAATASPQMVLTDGGRVGINQSAPGYLLEVDGAAYSTVGWSSPSDARLKQDVAQITDGLATIEKLRGVRFQWKPAAQRDVGQKLILPVDHPQVGFIAQEVEKVVPEAVTPPGIGGSDTYAMDETKLIPILVEAIKEQQTEIDQLRTEIAASKK